jgi:putative ABC transport system permease protein
MRATAATFVGISDAQFARIRALPGVQAAARVGLVGSLPTQVPGRAAEPTVDVYLADTAELAQVQRHVPGAPPVPAGMTTGSPASVVLSPDLAATGDSVRVGTVPARVVDTATALTGIGRSTTFALLDSAVTGFGPFRPTTVLLAPAPGSDPAALTAGLQQILGPGTVVRTAAQDAATLRTGAMSVGMRTALVASLGAAALAAVVALLLTMIMSVGARARLLAILRVLGLSVRQRRAVVLWEQAPAALVALVVGVGLGIGLAALVRATVDLAPFTGGSTQPVLHGDGGLLAALLGGFVVLVAVATWLGLVATRRVTAAVAVKLDEE